MKKLQLILALNGKVKWIQVPDSPRKREYKYWEESKLIEPVNGIVVGMRNLSNGKNEYVHEYGNVYEPKEHFRALVIAYGIFRKPILVPLPSPPKQ